MNIPKLSLYSLYCWKTNNDNFLFSACFLPISALLLFSSSPYIYMELNIQWNQFNNFCSSLSTTLFFKYVVSWQKQPNLLLITIKKPTTFHVVACVNQRLCTWLLWNFLKEFENVRVFLFKKKMYELKIDVLQCLTA